MEAQAVARVRDGALHAGDAAGPHRRAPATQDLGALRVDPAAEIEEMPNAFVFGLKRANMEFDFV